MEKIPTVDLESVENIPAWKAELKTIIDGAPEKIQEELDRSTDVTWIAALASRLTVFAGKLDLAVLLGKVSEEAVSTVHERINQLSSKVMDLKNEFAGRHDEILDSDKSALMADFETLLEE